MAFLSFLSRTVDIFALYITILIFTKSDVGYMLVHPYTIQFGVIDLRFKINFSSAPFRCCAPTMKSKFSCPTLHRKKWKLLTEDLNDRTILKLSLPLFPSHDEPERLLISFSYDTFIEISTWGERGPQLSIKFESVFFLPTKNL